MSVHPKLAAFGRWVAAVMPIVVAAAASAEIRYVELASYAVGDERARVARYSDAMLTEYRFEVGGHSYALARALRGVVERDLIFIDDRLACVHGKRRYPDNASFDGTPRQFWTDKHLWDEPIGKWEWAYEPGGLDYLAAMLREACGLEAIQERRALTGDWGRRSDTPKERKEKFAETSEDVARYFSTWGLLALFSGGYGPSYESPYDLQKYTRIDRTEVEQFVSSLPLGSVHEDIPVTFGVADAEYVWPQTGTLVHAYRLGTLSRFFIGIVDGRVAWIHADYPGLTLQAKMSLSQPAGPGP